jgi:protein-S-isoprenylcysteine O-methyltransferase Ste14
LLLSAVLITFYFVVGSRLEEGKLMEYYGEVYKCYRAQVPALIPLPWRYLNKEAATALEQQAQSGKG